MVAAASFNSRITIQTKTVARSAMGDETETWTDLATVWAVRRDLRGEELTRKPVAIGGRKRNQELYCTSGTRDAR